MPIKAIDTRYGGYLFRSRLEARWAVFFDQLGLKWDYENEGYELPSGRYLPDFSLPAFNLLVEIKPEPSEALIDEDTLIFPDEPVPGLREKRFARELARLNKPTVIFYGDPWKTFTNESKRVFAPGDYWGNTRAWQDLRVAIMTEEGLAAAKYAREARFEHGAKP